MPVIILFDPHASGLLPVQKYRELAEKNRFILIGSCNSKNGQAPAESEHIVLTLLAEAKTRYDADTGRIYLAGFSGGSRVASLFAMTHPGIEGVIGCGAGFPGLNQVSAGTFSYFGCIGLADFNLSEMIRLGALLSQSGSNHFIQVFNGIHEWPPAETFGMAMDWMTMRAMQEGKIKKDNTVIETFRKRTEQEARNLSRDKKFLESHSALEYERSALAGIADQSAIMNELSDLEKRPEYWEQKALREKTLAGEQADQQKMMADLFTKDQKWWSSEVNRLRAGKKVSSGNEECMKNERLLSFLSLLCYSNAHAIIKQGNTELAFRVIDVYETADPANPEPNYLRAFLFMERSDTVQSMAQLKKAIDKGFSDRVRLLDQPEFSGLKEYRPYFDLLQRIK
jgi:hypothetical protein